MIKAHTLTQVTELLENSVDSLPLVQSAKDIIPGEGNESAQIVFIGEAPGYHETVERRPFVGRSGKLLRTTIDAVGLEASQYYISNIVKARPPDNRDPIPEEIAAYKPYLDAEISIINPSLIVTLGRFSMAKFLPEVKISQVHGRLHKVTWEGSVLYILPMYHPAAGLRSTKVKESFIHDFKKIAAILKYITQQKELQDDAQQVLTALQ